MKKSDCIILEELNFQLSFGHGILRKGQTDERSPFVGLVKRSLSVAVTEFVLCGAEAELQRLTEVKNNHKRSRKLARRVQSHFSQQTIRVIGVPDKVLPHVISEGSI